MKAGDVMELGYWIGIIGTVSGLLIGWFGKARQAGETSGSMRVDMEYIKRGVDDVRVEQRVQGQRFDTLSERVTRVEESVGSAHKRIDEIKKG